MKSSLDIARASQPKRIEEIAEKLEIPSDFLEPYGHFKAKVHLDVLQTLKNKRNGKYILVSAVTPTPLGEGKTVSTIGLGMALNRIGKSASVTLRQSSLGPTFGIKGGGAGGGRSQIIPLEESILHVTGDIHAIGQAHNQIAAQLDNSLFQKNPLKIDADRILLRRVVDINDRVLRNVTVGQGRPTDGILRTSGFDITVASELMAILALVNGESQREAVHQLRGRIGKMVVALNESGAAVTSEQIRAAGAATVLMRETLKPNLMQTIENTPAFVHAGPFANIAHGNCSILSDRLALKCSDYVVTEAGFGMDIGGEKFFDIKCRESGLWPSAVVLVTTVRALKMHSGNYEVKVGRTLPPEILKENPDDVLEGACNLESHIRIARKFGIPVLVAINAHPQDFVSEHKVIRDVAIKAGAADAIVSNVFAQGGEGGVDLAKKLVEVCDRWEEKGAKTVEPRFLYPVEDPIRKKIERIAVDVYGASGVEYSADADRQIDEFERLGFGKLPICMAKTPLSLSHDPKKKGAPRDYVFPIREVRASIGAGFIYPIAGDMMTMPGLGADPAGAHIDIDEDGNTVGLY